MTNGLGRAIIAMVKQPTAGRSKTRLTPHLSAADAAALSEQMMGDTVAVARAVDSATLLLAVTPPSSHDWFAHFAPDADRLEQRGATLGERLDAVLTEALEHGDSPVVAINSDSPTLPAGHVERAFELLDDADTDIVIGPTVDGGYYLIGWKQRHAPVVTNVEMSTPQVCADTIAQAEALGLKVALAPEWYDVDEPADLDRLRRDLATDLQVAPRTRRFLASRSGA